ncbi:MAG: hypothetical protein NTW96_13795 [Planctomycetia bacterium]|nr:hypothetical protein [Planctomycetia bacterium]
MIQQHVDQRPADHLAVGRIEVARRPFEKPLRVLVKAIAGARWRR